MTWAAPKVSSRRILACRDTLAAGLSTQHSGLDADFDDPIDAPPGVGVMVFSAPPAFVAPLRATDLTDLHRQAIESAWAEGAWDLALTYHPPLQGVELGLVTAAKDYSSDPGMCEILIDAAERGRLATWFWRPMRDGPAIRLKAHAAKDATLDPDGGRSTPLPDLVTPALDWQKSRSWVICLGRWSDAHRPTARARPATVNQRGYLGRLLRIAGEHGRLPPRLSFDEASAWIDRLKGAP